MTHELQRLSFVPAGDRPEGRWSVEAGPSLILERQKFCFRATVDRVQHFNLNCNPATSGQVRRGIVLRSLGREITIQGGRYFALSPARRQATITYGDIQWVAEPHAAKGLLISRTGDLVGKIRRNRPFVSVAAEDLDLLVGLRRRFPRV